jgi:23S rRNA pseudouridine2605 synthase
VAHAAAMLTVMLHKPAGYITSRSDPQGRPVVMDLLPEGRHRQLYPVGRLDWDSEGLLLLTNDGGLANRLTHPRHAVPRVYHAKLKGRPTPEALLRLRQGVMSEGERLVAGSAEFLRGTRENSWVVIRLEQGRNRQVRRMCEAIGHPVLKLLRVALGPLALGDLPRGHWRSLTDGELAALAIAGVTETA